MEHICRNCGAAFDGKFCNNCGQKHDVPRFTYKHIIEEAFHAFTHADKSFLSFAKQLIISPGRLGYEYIVERKRKKYFNPFTFFLLVLAIGLFIDHHRLILEEDLFHLNNEYADLFNVYGKVMFFAMIPLIALALWLLPSVKPKLKYSEYTVFAMLLMSVYTIVKTVTSLIDYLVQFVLKMQFRVSDNLFFVGLIVIYMAYADYGFQSRLGKKSLVRSFFAGLSVELSSAIMVVFILWWVIGRFHPLGTIDMYGIRLNFSQE